MLRTHKPKTRPTKAKAVQSRLAVNLSRCRCVMLGATPCFMKTTLYSRIDGCWRKLRSHASTRQSGCRRILQQIYFDDHMHAPKPSFTTAGRWVPSPEQWQLRFHGKGKGLQGCGDIFFSSASNICALLRHLHDRSLHSDTFISDPQCQGRRCYQEIVVTNTFTSSTIQQLGTVLQQLN